MQIFELWSTIKKSIMRHHVVPILTISLIHFTLFPMNNIIHEQGFVPVPGGQVWFQKSYTKESEHKAPLLIVHGGPGVSHHYLSNLTALATERPIILYDQLGSGASKPTNPDNSSWVLPRFVEELGAVIAHHKLQGFHLMGHSWGGALVGTYALQCPQGIKTLTLASPLLSTKRFAEDAKELLKTLPAEVQAIIEHHEKAGTTDSKEYLDAAQVFYDHFLCRTKLPKDPNQTFNFDVYLTMWGPSEFTVTGNLLDFDILAKLHELEMPVLITAGRFDEVRPETMEYASSRIKKATLAIFEKSAHRSHEEEQELYVQTLKDFLNNHEKS